MVFKPIEPNVWKFENEGDEVVGTLLRVEEDKGKYKSRIFHIETEDGKQLSVFGSAVLNDKMSYISLGDKIKIVFRGKVQGKEAEYNDFEVFKDFQN